MAVKPKKEKKQFVCTDCGSSYLKWQGQCHDCGQWNTIIETTGETNKTKRAAATSTKSKAQPLPITEVAQNESFRLSTGLRHFDRLLGGGIVPGGLSLIAGEPGVGKSTLLLEMAKSFSGKVYYFSGEESAGQLRIRAERLGALTDNLYVMAETDAQTIIDFCYKDKPDLVFVDSIQTVYHRDLNYAMGSVGQIRELTLLFMELAKATGIPVFLIGHITKDGQIAGPKILEHIVDCVLYFEGDRLDQYRILRAKKNRFGGVGEIDIFAMTGQGLVEIDNASQLFIESERATGPGSCYAVSMEGSRPIALEIQALVSRAPFSNPRRLAEGYDTRRLSILAAVLDKFLKVNLAERDVFVNIAGGIRADEPGLDLAVTMAILSSLKEITIPRKTAFLGEVGLLGEIRGVSHIESRIRELVTLGINQIVLPTSNKRELNAGDGTDQSIITGNELLDWSNVTDCIHHLESLGR